MKTLLLSLLLFTPFALGKGTYQTPENFIKEALGDQAVSKKTLWLDAEKKAVIETIVAHKFSKLRVRYWQHENETAWILNEIGKESPITIGIHVRNHAIVKTKVLIYRESRGDEVRHDFFTNQFTAATLNDDLSLDRDIDGITGATLSVRALTKMSRLALWLDQQVNKNTLTASVAQAK